MDIQFFREKKLKPIVYLVLVGIAGFVVGRYSSSADVLDSVDPTSALAKHGTVVDKKAVVGGLVQWTIDKVDSKQSVVYTTADGQALISGSIWDLKSGQKIITKSDEGLMQASSGGKNLTATNQVPVAQNGLSIPAAMDGKFSGSIPEAMKTVDSLAGIKEGSGSIENTVYIIIDPRCPYCQQAYANTREYVKRGHSIKWIPTSALGSPETGNQLSATLLQSQDKNVLEKILGQHQVINTTPMPASVQHLNKSMDFLLAAFQQNGGKPAGVPAAFFLDHRTGKARMMTGVSEMVILEDIFGKL